MRTRDRRRWVALICATCALVVAGGAAGTATAAKPTVTWQNTQDASYPAYSSVTLTVTAAEKGGKVVNVRFFDASTGVTLATVTSTTSTFGYVWPSVAPGSYSIGATATDARGNRGSAPTLRLTVQNAVTYTLTVIGGTGATGSGQYPAGTVVPIGAGTPPAGQVFKEWTGATVADRHSASTTLTMPAANTTLTATFGNVYTLTVKGGVGATGGGQYTAGTVVSIGAGTPPAGQVFQQWTGATVANPYASSTTLTMPAADTTVTATFTGSTTYSLTVVGGTGATGSGQYTAGTVVSISAGTAPAGQVFQQWTGATVADPHSASTTLTMPAAAATVTATFATAPTIPEPVTTHPRLWITQADLPRLRSWAVSTNPIYQQGFIPVLQQAISVYQTQFAPFFGPSPPSTPYPDPGDTQGYTGYLSEQYGLILAFDSLIDPDAAAAAQHAQWARNLLMYALDQAAQGPLAGAPFRDPLFPVYNRANGSGEDWPLIVDWIYPTLTAQDKATIQKVFIQWANTCLNAYTTGGDHPAPIGVENSTQLLPNGGAYRMAANNYYLGHARLLTLMSLSLNTADDPPVDQTKPASALGNSVRSFIPDATGAWLYQEYAMFGEPTTVAADYGLASSSGVGLASGGLPPEGMLYGHSFSFLLGQLLALQTAGFGSQLLTGPQAKLIAAPFWGRMVNGFISSLVPAAKVFPSDAYMGPVYQMASYGDLLRLWMTPDFVQPYALLSELERATGQVDGSGRPVDDNSSRWFSINALQGGSSYLMQRITNPWSLDEPILYFLMMDPGAPNATDPRAALPTSFVDRRQGRVISRTGWNANATMFDYRGSWESINHQDADAGQFELYRNGEWLTKEMSNYDNSGVGQASPYHNTLSLQNTAQTNPPANIQWWEQPLWTLGSQFYLGQSAGDPTTAISTGPSYTYASSDLTNLYNRPDVWDPASSATAITAASRSIVWLNGDYVVTYDRATSTQSGLFKRSNLELVTQPTISGNGKVATEVTPNGQELYVQALLPAAGQMSVINGAAALSSTAWLEPTVWQLTTQDPSNPADVRFLHVLQGADPGAPMSPATLLGSVSGNAFDGASFAGNAVFFAHTLATSFTGTTLPLPSGTTTLLVANLSPGASYGVAVGGGTVTISPGGSSAQADSAGLLRLTF